MKKKPVATTTHELAPLVSELRGLIQSARHAVATKVNTLLFSLSWSHYVLLLTIKNPEERLRAVPISTLWGSPA